jgi:hypothetical protein
MMAHESVSRSSSPPERRGRGREFTTNDFLLALRSAKPFERSSIHRAVLTAAGLLDPGDSVASDPGGLAAEYRRFLTNDLGYSFQRAGSDSDVVYRERQLLTFTTKYRCNPGAGEDSKDLEPCEERALEAVRATLEATGFGRMVSLVLLTDHPRAAIQREFPDVNPARYMKWYYLTAHAAYTPDLPQGCLFYHGRSRFPCLVLRPPRREGAGTLADALRMRVIHELVHYYLTFTLLLEDEHPFSEGILEMAGQTVGELLLDLITECFAHADTAGFEGNAFFSCAPRKATSVVSHLEDPAAKLSPHLLGWLRRRRQAYFRTVRFLSVFPWMCASLTHRGEEDCWALVELLEPPFDRLAGELLAPMTAMYATGGLRGRDILAMIEAIERVPGVLAQVTAWGALNEFFAEYSGGMDLFQGQPSR